MRRIALSIGLSLVLTGAALAGPRTSVSIVSPTPGSTLVGTSSVEAVVSTLPGIARLEFWVDGSMASTAYGPSYTFAWDTTTVTNGTHTIEARALDVRGRPTKSERVSVTVNNAPAPSPPPATPPPTPTSTSDASTAAPPASGLVVWSSNFETGNLSQWQSGQTLNPQQNSGGGYTEVAPGIGRGGGYGLRAIAPIDGAATRLFRVVESRSGADLVYSAWYEIPSPIHVGSNWNVFQFKSKSEDGTKNEPFFSFNLFDTSTGYRLRVYAKPNGCSCNDPANGWLPEVGSTVRAQAGQWFRITAFLHQSPIGEKQGVLRVWLNGRLVVDVSGVATKYTAAAQQNWSINNYGHSLLPYPAVLLMDDAQIATP
jgi:hypothetical protein